MPLLFRWCILPLKEVHHASCSSFSRFQAFQRWQVPPPGQAHESGQYARPDEGRHSAVVACFAPLSAFRDQSGAVQFHDTGGGDPLQLPCGRCVGCRLERARQWAVRCVHEASLHERNSFVTLTYAEAPPSLDYRDFQLFMRRLRRHFRPARVRFFAVGEYGAKLSRPHFHALLFGVGFDDARLFSRRDGQNPLFVSSTLDRLWSHGYATIGEVNFETAAYCARYILKKITGDAAHEHYSTLDPLTGEITFQVPEMAQMSRRPGIGQDWLRLFWPDVAGGDAIVVNGREQKPPRYYDRIMCKLGASEDSALKRYQRRVAHASDNTDERLRVREHVAKARISNNKRGYEQ